MTCDQRKRYPSDLTDQQWEIVSELIPQSRKSRKGGRPRSVDMREVLNTILYQCRSGCQWDMLPHDLLAKSTVYDYFAKWRDDGTLRKINDRLVAAIRMLEAPSEEMEPSAASIDSQSVKTSERSGSRGYDGGKKITGRKRNIAVDSLGLLLAVTVTIASVDDAYAARPVMKQLSQSRQPRLQVIWADSKYHNHALNAWLGLADRRTWLGSWKSFVVPRGQKDLCCCPNAGLSNAPSVGLDAGDGSVVTTNIEPNQAKRSDGPSRIDRKNAQATRAVGRPTAVQIRTYGLKRFPDRF